VETYASTLGDKLRAQGADPNLDLGWLRATTPLHEASTAAIAGLLLAAGARSGASGNPREPPPAWYHAHRGRHDVANAIRAFRARGSDAPPEQLGPRRLLSSGNDVGGHGGGDNFGGDGGEVEGRTVYPGLTVVQLRRAVERFARANGSCSDGGGADAEAEAEAGATANPLLRDDRGVCSSGSDRGCGSACDRVTCECRPAAAECPICLEPLSSPPPRPSALAHLLHPPPQPPPQPPLLHGARGQATGGGVGGGADSSPLVDRLCGESRWGDPLRGLVLATPCNQGHSVGPSAGLEPAAEAALAPASAPERHAFHAACLVDWLHRSCRCPLCKADLRPHLRD